jgi:hypothetical protein
MLSRPAAFSILAALVLAVSLGIQAERARANMPLDSLRYERELSALLARQGFASQIELRKGDIRILTAARGDCRLRIQPQDDSVGEDSFAFFARDFPVLKYRYQGALIGGFPREWLAFRSRFERFEMRYGLAEGVERPLLIAATQSCELPAIDFGPQYFYLKRG